MLISVALFGYYGLNEIEEQGDLSAKLGFERRAEGQLNWEEIVKIALETDWKKGEGRVRKVV